MNRGKEGGREVIKLDEWMDGMCKEGKRERIGGEGKGKEYKDER